MARPDEELMAKLAPDRAPKPVLDLRNLRIAFGGRPAVVDGLELTLLPGQTLCLVGESGSGKSATALAVMRLLPPDAAVSADHFSLDGTDLSAASTVDLAGLRGDRMAIVFQDASQSLHPLMTIGRQITEALTAHRRVTSSKARAEALVMLDRLHLPGGNARLGLYPHQLSGGMRQRVLIAMALICQPRLLIADEPTSSLDAVVQREIMRLIRDLSREIGTAVLLITHDLMLARESADEIAVIHAGQIVERGRRADIFDDPMHPYTLTLLSAFAGQAGPEVNRAAATAPGTGCVFHPRCPVAFDQCRTSRPTLGAVSETHSVACWRAPLEAMRL
jgi:peptide/nickel transport system ATP-binding protein